jgi:hypothetical protein
MLRFILLSIPVLFVASVILLGKTFGSKEENVLEKPVNSQQEIQAKVTDQQTNSSRFVEIRGYWKNGEKGFVHTDQGRFDFGKPARINGQDVYLLSIDPDYNLLHVYTERHELWPYILVPIPYQNLQTTMK